MAIHLKISEKWCCIKW